MEQGFFQVAATSARSGRLQCVQGVKCTILQSYMLWDCFAVLGKVTVSMVCSRSLYGALTAYYSLYPAEPSLATNRVINDKRTPHGTHAINSYETIIAIRQEKGSGIRTYVLNPKYGWRDTLKSLL